LSIFYKERSQI